MPSKGFSVDTAKLLDVAKSVRELHDDLSGVGSAAGSLPQYKQKAAASILRDALASFWDGPDVFATAYGVEQQGIVTTMNSMLSQLAQLEKACRGTAEQYGTHEHATKTTVSKTEPGGWHHGS